MIALLAVLFSLIAPGAGHALTGDWTQSVVLGGVFALGKTTLLPLSLRMFRVRTVRRTLQFVYVCNWCYIALIFYAVVSAFGCGLKAQEIYFLHACLFAVAIILVQKNTRNKFIFASLCGREGVYELLQKMHNSPTEKKKK